MKETSIIRVRIEKVINLYLLSYSDHRGHAEVSWDWIFRNVIRTSSSNRSPLLEGLSSLDKIPFVRADWRSIATLLSPCSSCLHTCPASETTLARRLLSEVFDGSVWYGKYRMQRL